MPTTSVRLDDSDLAALQVIQSRFGLSQTAAIRFALRVASTVKLSSEEKAPKPDPQPVSHADSASARPVRKGQLATASSGKLVSHARAASAQVEPEGQDLRQRPAANPALAAALARARAAGA